MHVYYPRPNALTALSTSPALQVEAFSVEQASNGSFLQRMVHRQARSLARPGTLSEGGAGIAP